MSASATDLFGRSRVRARRPGPLVAPILALLTLIGCSAPPPPPAAGLDPIRIGVVTICEGTLAQNRDLNLAGAELPFIERGAHTIAKGDPRDGVTSIPVAGRRVEFIYACEHGGDRSTTISALSTLVERRGADVVIGADWPLDGVALREYARAHPDVTFINTSFEQSSTLVRPVPNLYRFEADQYQWTAPLGTYARQTLGWSSAATFGDADEPGYQVGGFIATFCSLGGQVAEADRLFLDQSPHEVDPGHLVSRIPGTVEGLLLTGTTIFGPVGGTGTMAPRWEQAHAPLKRHLLVGWQLLYPKPDPVLRGVVGASSDPFRPAPPAWRQYLKAFSDAFPRLDDPYLSNQPYYDGVEPVLEALEKVNGDLSDGQRRFSDALAHLRYHSPEGLITLDRRHQAIAPIYLGRVVVPAHGEPYVKQIHVFKHVHQTLGGLFSRTSPPPSQTQPACRAG